MEKKKKFIINVVFYAMILILVWAGVKYLVMPMMPFIIAFLVAALLQIPVRKTKLSGKRKKAASIAACSMGRLARNTSSPALRPGTATGYGT